MHMADVLVLRGFTGPPRVARSYSAPGGVGYAPQRATFPAWLTGAEIARLFELDFDAVSARLPALYLGELRDVPGGRMSVGQMTVLSVAIALASDHHLTLLDEPFAPLDLRRRIGLTAILQRMQYSSRVVIMSAQSAAEIVDVCSWTVVLKKGRVVWEGPVAALTGPGLPGEAAVLTVERRLLALLDESSALRRPSACRPP
jgi:ABC-type multidrug transport system ATPase subunit